MSKEKKVREHKILSNPIAALILLMIWGMTFYDAVGAIFQFAFGEDFAGWGAALGAVIALVLHRLWFAPEYKGSVGKPNLRAKDAMIAFAGFAAMVIIIDLLGFIGHDIAFTLPNLGLALMAGIGEEMFVRVLPISVMMRDWMDEKHVPFVAYSTALVFGLIHLTNITSGAPVDITIIQVLLACGIGTFFAAFYLRTGNILLCIVFHAIHDMLCFMIVGATDNGVMQSITTFDAVTSIIIGIVGAIVGTYMIRKSVRADIVDVWKERWSVDAEVA